jgi:Family of unknown function (DUF6519)
LPPPGGDANAATFKWSRENGSVIFPINDLKGDTVTVRDLGREHRFGLRPDDWVEVVDDDYTLQNRAEPLLQVKEVRRDTNQLILKQSPGSTFGTEPTKHRLLRRWDQPSQPIPIVETTGNENTNWIFTLEDGVQIQFPGTETADKTAFYRTGDYWLIPARVATGDVEWPGPPEDPGARPPYGVAHAFAPLGIVSFQTDGSISLVTDLRREIKPLTL